MDKPRFMVAVNLNILKPEGWVTQTINSRTFKTEEEAETLWRMLSKELLRELLKYRAEEMKKPYIPNESN